MRNVRVYHNALISGNFWEYDISVQHCVYGNEGSGMVVSDPFEFFSADVIISVESTN